MNNQTAIIVLTHNNLDVTKKFLDLLFQYTDNFYPIIIDNGSTDGTVDFLDKKEYISKNIDMTLVYNQDNLGVIGGRNQGYSLSKSIQDIDYICFLDNDQFVKKGWLDQYYSFIDKGNYDIVGCDAWLMNRDFKPIYNCKKSSDPFSYVGCGGMFLKKDVAFNLEINGCIFDEIFNPAYFEDPDLNFRARLKNYKIGWNYEAKIIHFPHQTLGKSPERMRLFLNSYSSFLSKWKSHSFNPIIQI
jgi:GT2 family glycosyltransferase